MNLRLLLALLVVSAALHHIGLVTDLNRRGENSIDEAEVLHGVQRVRAGQTLYRDYRQPPHVLTTYPPLFYWLPGLVARWTGLGATGTVLLARIYVYGCWLGIAAVIFALARRWGGSTGAAWLGALLWLAGAVAPEWANSYRPDAPAILLALLAVWLHLGGHERWRSFAVGALLGAAFLQKHAAIAPLLVVGWQRRADLWRLVAGWLAVAGGVMGAMDVASAGAFRLNVFGALAQPQGWRWPAVLLGVNLWAGLPAFVGAAVAWWALPRERTSLWRGYFATALGVAWLTSFKAGSWSNYYLEPFAVACVLAGLLWDAAPQRARTVWFLTALVGTTLVLTDRLAQHPSEDPAAWDALTARLQTLGRPLLVESSRVAFAADAEPFMVNPTSFGRLARRGVFDTRPVQERIARREFAAIVASARLEETHGFPAECVALMRQHYRLAEIWPGTGGTPTLFVYRSVQ